jgi:hypothetical protein
MPTARTFVLQKLFNRTDGVGRAFPIPRAGAQPIAVYRGVSTAGSSRIVASTLPLIEGDGGATVTTYAATPLAQIDAFSPGDARFTSAGEVRLAYLSASATGYKPRYLEWNGDLAQTATDVVVGTDSAFTAVPVISLDGSGRAFVAYFANDSSLRLATRAGASWTVETVKTGLIVPNSQIALAVDAGGQAFVFLTGLGLAGTPGPVGLSVFTKGASGWSSTPLDTSDSAHAPRAARAPSGDVMVLFVSQGRIARGVLRGGSWQLEAPLGNVIGEAVDDAGGFDVAVAAGDVVHIAAGDGGRVAHLVYNDCVWFKEFVDPDTINGSIGFGIALDGSGNPYFAYQKRVTGGASPTYEIWHAAPQP